MLRTAPVLLFLLASLAQAEKVPNAPREAVKAYIRGLTRQDPKAVIASLGEAILRTAEAYAVDPATGKAPSREAAITKFLSLDDKNKKFAPDIKDGKPLGEAWDVTLRYPNGETIVVRVAPEGKVMKVVDIDGRAESRQELLVAEGLRKVLGAERNWQGADTDGNGQQDFWVADVAGLFFAKLPDGSRVSFLDEKVARADKAALAAYSTDAPQPREGYWVRAVAQDEEGKPFAQGADTHGKAATNAARFAVCAWPDAYGNPCIESLILDEAGVVYAKDLGSKASGLDRWPGKEPPKVGWKKVE